jgi:hypothetical protein
MVLHKITKERAQDSKNSARAQTEIEANRKLWADLATFPHMQKKYISQAQSIDNCCESPGTRGTYLERKTRSSKQERLNKWQPRGT